jgi:hypothetical protein
VTFREDAQKAHTGSQPNAYAAVRNRVIGATRDVGFANIAHARRYYARDDQRNPRPLRIHLNRHPEHHVT